MAKAKPVIATQISDIPELVINGKTGLLVTPKDESALTTALECLILYKELCSRLDANSKNMVIKEFNINKEVEKLSKLLAT